MREYFRIFAHKVSEVVGTPIAFFFAFGSILTWAILGPVFNFSSSWQLVVNTCTTIVTFLMVFLIQSAQNRDSKAIQLKLDELLRVIKPARDSFVDLEEMGDAELEKIEGEFRDFSERARGEARHREAKKVLTKKKD